MWPVYCPLRFEFDARAIENELLFLVPRFVPILVSEGPTLAERRREFFMVEDDDHYDNVDRSRNGKPIIGKYRSLEGVSLRLLNGEVNPRNDSVINRKADDCSGWDWNPAFHLDYTKQVIESLPFERLRSIRLLSLPPGGFLPVHRDAIDDSYWDAGHATLSLLINTGGEPMQFLHRGVVHHVDDPAFFFKDSAPHGVATVSGRRLLLRISGIADQARLTDMLETYRAIQ